MYNIMYVNFIYFIYVSTKYTYMPTVSVGTMTPKSPDHASAAFSLLLPGEVLHLSAILVAKKLRPINGNKESAVRGFRILEEAGLGRLVELNPQRGATMVCKSISFAKVHLIVYMHFTILTRHTNLSRPPSQ